MLARNSELKTHNSILELNSFFYNHCSVKYRHIGKLTVTLIGSDSKKIRKKIAGGIKCPPGLHQAKVKLAYQSEV